MWFIELGLHADFNLKCGRFFTKAIFTGSASTVHNSMKIMFQNFTFWCYPGYDTWPYMLISAKYSVSGIRSYFSCSKTPKLG